MIDIKTKQLLQHYYDIIKGFDCGGGITEEDENFLRCFKFDFAKNIIDDFGSENAIKIAKLILASENSI